MSPPKLSNQTFKDCVNTLSIYNTRQLNSIMHDAGASNVMQFVEERRGLKSEWENADFHHVLETTVMLNNHVEHPYSDDSE